MALQGSLLDRPTARDTTTPEYPPEVIARMKQMGIWHPGMTYPLQSKRGQEEAEIMSSILTQHQRSQELGETRAYRSQAHEENLGQRQIAQQQLDEYRQERLGQQSEVGKARVAQTLQFMLNDPTMQKIYERNPEVKRQMADAMLRNTGLEPPTAPAPGVATKGEYGPGGAPAGAPPPATAADVTTGTPLSTAQGGGGTPEAPRPLARYFQPQRYAGALNPSQMARAASNLDAVQAADEYANMLLYKRDIGGPAFERIYGTSDPSLIKPGMAPAEAIPALYGGTPKIPAGGQRGYYKDGEFLGPAYTPEGQHIPMPKGATGLYGTADLSPEEKMAMIKSPEAFSKVTPHYPGEVAQPAAIKSAPPVAGGVPTTTPEQVAALEAPSGLYKPPTGAFTTPVAEAAPTPVPSGGAVQSGPFGIPTFPAFHPRQWDTQVQMTPWGVPTVVSTERPKRPTVATQY